MEGLSEESFAGQLAEVVASSFYPQDLALSTDSENVRMSFHDCLRTVIGTNPEWSPLAYRNSDSLFKYVASVYDCLSADLNTNSEFWLLRIERTAEEVLSLLQKLAEKLNKIEIPPITPRPGIRRVQGPGKPRAAIAVEAAVVASQERIGFGPVLSMGLASSSNDSQMISWLETRAGTDVDESQIDWKLAKAFSLAAGNWLRFSEKTTVRVFCLALGDDLSKVPDDQLLKRLKETGRT